MNLGGFLFRRIRSVRLAALTAALSAAQAASANPRPLPFTYTYETLPEGGREIEQYADLTPVRVYTANAATPVWYTATQFQTEFEYGLTDRLELGLYVTLVPTSSSFSFTPSLPQGNGVKQRLRYRFADAGSGPVDLAVYAEVAENEREIELEGKLIVQRRVGPIRLAGNAWVEREFYYTGPGEWVINPTIGAVLEALPRLEVGIEYWMRAEYPDQAEPRVFNRGPNHFLGPTLMVQFSDFWWSTGVYARINELHRTAAVGDAFGPVWIRMVVGLHL